MSDFDEVSFEESVIARSKMTKKQLWASMSKDSAYDHVNEKHATSLHFVRAVKQNHSVKSRREFFFSRKEELGIKITQQTFMDEERKLRELITGAVLIHSNVVEDFILSVLEQKTIKSRASDFFSRSERNAQLHTESEYRTLEAKHRELILEMRDESIEKIARRVESLDKRSVIIQIQNIAIDETKKRYVTWAKEIPERNKQLRDLQLLSSGKATVVKSATGETKIVEKDPWFYKWGFAGVIALVIYILAPDFSGEDAGLEEYCRKYKINYPYRSRDDCEASYREIQNWD